LVPHELGSQFGEPPEPAALMPGLNNQVLALNVAELAEPLPKGFEPRRIGGRGHGREIPQVRDFLRLLRLDRFAEREQRCAQKPPQILSLHGWPLFVWVGSMPSLPLSRPRPTRCTSR